MKKFLLLFLLASTTKFCLGQFNPDKDPYMTKPLTNDAIKDVFVETSGGSITVTGVNPSEAKIEVYVRPSNGRDDKTYSKGEIEERLNELYDLAVTASGGKLTATAKAKKRNMDWKRSLSISFKIYVPRNISTDLSTSGGSIHLSNLAGTLNFSTSGGSLHLDNVAGKVHGRTSGGSIHVENATDDVDLSTSGGSIEASNCSGKLRLSTSGGSLDLNGLKGDIRAETSGGSIEGRDIEGEFVSSTSGGSIRFRDLACSLETSTSGGNIDISMKELGKYIKISNSAGNISLEIPKSKSVDLDLTANRVRTDHLENFNGSVDEDAIRGKLNGGGIPITVRAGSGKISLELK